jgi:hypothetical protein
MPGVWGSEQLGIPIYRVKNKRVIPAWFERP